MKKKKIAKLFLSEKSRVSRYLIYPSAVPLKLIVPRAQSHKPRNFRNFFVA